MKQPDRFALKYISNNMKKKYNFTDVINRGRGVFVTLNKQHMYLSLAFRTHAKIVEGTSLQILVDRENDAILVSVGKGNAKTYKGGLMCTLSARSTGMSTGTYELVSHEKRTYIFEKRTV